MERGWEGWIFIKGFWEGLKYFLMGMDLQGSSWKRL
jgi:hypothetical protein